MARWAITDIHGCNKTFVGLVDHLELEEDDQLYLLGDYIDRGPDSKGVFDTIFNLESNGINVHCLRGNHEQMMLETFNGELAESNWMLNGGHSTLDSFGVERVQEVSDKYISFLKQLPYYFELEEYVLVHAGLNTDTASPFEDKHAMLWIRGHEHDPAAINHKTVVHGHTPIPYEKVKDQVEQQNSPLINLDNGCVYKGKRDGMGKLCALELNERRLISLENQDF